jgi:hypothetical protein
VLVDGSGPGAPIACADDCGPGRLTRLEAELGGGNDRLRLEQASFPGGVRVQGGPGSDGLTGSPGGDLLDGGPDRDAVDAGGGADLVVLRDAAGDDIANCGGDPGDRVELDPGDLFQACATVSRTALRDIWPPRLSALRISGRALRFRMSEPGTVVLHYELARGRSWLRLPARHRLRVPRGAQFHILPVDEPGEGGLRRGRYRITFRAYDVAGNAAPAQRRIYVVP